MLLEFTGVAAGLTAAILSLYPASVTAGDTSAATPRPVVVALDSTATAYVHVLGGDPATVTMRSGFVTLLPGASVGRHNTETYEEAVVVLAGKGELRLADGSALKLKPYVVAYSPPGTEHDVVNTGTEPLRYVYIVARTATPERGGAPQKRAAPGGPR